MPLSLSRELKRAISHAAVASAAALLLLMLWKLYAEKSYLLLLVSVASVFTLALLAFYTVERYDRVRRQSLYDWLTQTATRAHFDEALHREVEKAHAQNQPLTLALLDLDGFKAYNDRFGHLAGDELLRKVAEVIKGNLRESDVVARFGGDEFAIILPSTRLSSAALVCRRLIDAVTAHFHSYVGIGASVGIAELKRGEGVRDLLHRADAALYEAKRQGGHRVEIAPKGALHASLKAIHSTSAQGTQMAK